MRVTAAIPALPLKRPRWKRVLVIGTGFVAALACAACGASQTQTVGDPISGYLTRVESQGHACLGIRPFLSGQPLAAEWPKGYQADLVHGVLRGPDGHVVARLHQAIVSEGLRRQAATDCARSGLVFALHGSVRAVKSPRQR